MSETSTLIEYKGRTIPREELFKGSGIAVEEWTPV